MIWSANLNTSKKSFYICKYFFTFEIVPNTNINSRSYDFIIIGPIYFRKDIYRTDLLDSVLSTLILTYFANQSLLNSTNYRSLRYCTQFDLFSIFSCKNKITSRAGLKQKQNNDVCQTVAHIGRLTCIWHVLEWALFLCGDIRSQENWFLTIQLQAILHTPAVFTLYIKHYLH